MKRKFSDSELGSEEEIPLFDSHTPFPRTNQTMMNRLLAGKKKEFKREYSYTATILETVDKYQVIEKLGLGTFG